MSSVDRFAVYVQGLTSQPFRCISAQGVYISVYTRALIGRGACLHESPSRVCIILLVSISGYAITHNFNH